MSADIMSEGFVWGLCSMGVTLVSVCILLHSTLMRKTLSNRKQVWLQILLFASGAVDIASASCCLQHLALCSCFWLFVPEVSPSISLSLQAVETAVMLGLIVTTNRPNMLLSLAAHVLVGMLVPAWMALSKGVFCNNLKGSPHVAASSEVRPTTAGQTSETELSLWLNAAICSISDRVVHPTKVGMSRSKSLTISESTGAASDTPPYSDAWKTPATPLEFSVSQENSQRRHHQLYGKARQPGKSDSFTSLQSTEQSMIGSIAWSQIDMEERGTLSEGLDTSVSRAQTNGGSGVSLAQPKEVHHLLWLASQASEALGAPPAIAAHLAVIAVAASQAAGRNLSQVALDVHTLWLHSLSGLHPTKRSHLLHSKLLHTATQSARTSTSQPGTNTPTAASHPDPSVGVITSPVTHVAAASDRAADASYLTAFLDSSGCSTVPQEVCSEIGPSTADLLRSVARTLVEGEGGCIPWRPFDSAAQDPYSGFSSASIPDRARRLLELTTINEGSEPSTAERGTWPMRSTQHLQAPLAPSAFSSDDDEHPHIITTSVAVTESEPRYQQQIRSISSLALRISEAQQPPQPSRTEVWAAAAGALNRKLAAVALGETTARSPGPEQSSTPVLHQHKRIHPWKRCTLLYKSVPGRGPSSNKTDTSSEEARPSQPVSGWLAARRRRLQRSVSMSALALEHDRHSHGRTNSSSTTSPQLQPLSVDGTRRASDHAHSRVHSNVSSGRAAGRQQGMVVGHRSTRVSASTVDPLSSSSHPSQVGFTPLISPRHSNSSVPKQSTHNSNSQDNTDNSSHVLALQSALDTLRGRSNATPPSISQPSLFHLQASSLHEFSAWPNSAPNTSAKGLLAESSEFLMVGTQGPHWRTHVRRASSLPLHNPFAAENAAVFASARVSQGIAQPGLAHQQSPPELEFTLPMIQMSGAGLRQDPAFHPRHFNRIPGHSPASSPVAHEKISRFASTSSKVMHGTSKDAHTLNSTSIASSIPQIPELTSSCISSSQQPLLPTAFPDLGIAPNASIATCSPACAGTDENCGPRLHTHTSSGLTSSKAAQHDLSSTNTWDRSLSLSLRAQAPDWTLAQPQDPLAQHSLVSRREPPNAISDLNMHTKGCTSETSSSSSNTPLPAIPVIQQPVGNLRTASQMLRQPSARAASFCFDAFAEAIETGEVDAAASPPSYFRNSASQQPPPPITAIPFLIPPPVCQEPQAVSETCELQVSVAAPVVSSRYSSASIGSGSQSPRHSTARFTLDSLEERQSLSTAVGLSSNSLTQRQSPTVSVSHSSQPQPCAPSMKGARQLSCGAKLDESAAQRLVSNELIRYSNPSNSSNHRSSEIHIPPGSDNRLEMYINGGMSVASGADGKRRSAPYVPPSYRESLSQVAYSQGEKWEVNSSVAVGTSAQSTTSLMVSGRNNGRATKDISTSSRLSNLDLNSWAGTCAPKPAVGVTQVFGIENGQAARQLGGGTLQVEAEIEDCIIANRRLLDERRVLLDEVNIDKILGFGSMGIVYFGQLFDTKVVIKLIEHGTGVLGKEQNRGRLARVEAVISRLLLHPNIVTTYDCCTGPINSSRLANLAVGKKQGHGRNAAGRERCMTVIVQEFCVLGTLKDALLRKKAGLDPADAIFVPAIMHLALGIANGMKHLASLRIMHADLKAENVLLQKVAPTQENPLGLLAKVADFGLAQILPLNGEIKAGIHGTVSHMPPEAMKETIFSLATDVFSFGVVLWEMVTQEAPYRGMLPHEVVEAVCESKKRLVWPPNIFPSLKQLAEDCWHEEPHSRPSFHQVVERLRVMVQRNACPVERHSNTSCSEESDELESALRAQKRTAGVQSMLHAIESCDSDQDTFNQQMGSTQGPETVASVMAQGFPGDPLGRILYLLCQMPPPSIQSTVDLAVIVEEQGQLLGSSIWVTECKNTG